MRTSFSSNPHRALIYSLLITHVFRERCHNNVLSMSPFIAFKNYHIAVETTTSHNRWVSNHENRRARAEVGSSVLIATTLNATSIPPTHPASVIGRNLLDSRHRVNLQSAFTMLLRHPNGCVLLFAETLATKRCSPILCVHNQLYTTLRMLWTYGLDDRV